MKKLRVLIVDDNEIFRDSLATLLEYSGHDYEVAANGKEALEKARDFRPDVMTLDIMMPGMNGFDVCRTLKSDPNLKHIYIIMLSAKDEDKDKNKAKACGADEYHIKPFSPTEIRDMINKLA